MKGDDQNQYQVELIHGLDHSPRRICGLRVACNETERWVAPLNWTTGDRPAIYRSLIPTLASLYMEPLYKCQM